MKRRKRSWIMQRGIISSSSSSSSSLWEEKSTLSHSSLLLDDATTTKLSYGHTEREKKKLIKMFPFFFSFFSLKRNSAQKCAMLYPMSMLLLYNFSFSLSFCCRQNFPLSVTASDVRPFPPSPSKKTPRSKLFFFLQKSQKNRVAQPPTVVCKMEAQSEYVHVAHTFFARLDVDSYAQSVLTNKISASELRRNFY